MRKIIARLVFGVWIVAAPLAFVGCSEEGAKPADKAAPVTTPAPKPAEKK